MTASNAQLVAELLDLIDQHRWSDLPHLLAADCVIERPGSAPLVGLARIKHFYRHERPVAAGHHELDEVVANAGAAACWGTFTGTTKDGHSIQERFADTFRLSGDKITHRTTYLHRAP
jgi:uncharacterized protein